MKAMQRVFSWLRSNPLPLIISLATILLLIARSNPLAYFDEGIYIGIAKFFATGGMSGLFESIRPLGLPLLLLPFQWLQGNALITGRILSGIIFLASLLLLYWISKLHFGKKSALWTTLIASTSFTMLSYAGYILNDIPAFILGTAAVSFAYHKQYKWSGLCLGGAFLLKFPTLIFVIPLTIVIVWQQKKRAFMPLLKTGGIASLLILPYFIFNILFYQGNFIERIFRPLLDASELIGGSSWIYETPRFWHYPSQLLTHEPLLAILLISTCFILYKRARKELFLFGGTALLFILYLTLSLGRYDPRYLLAFLPGFFILGGKSITFFTKRWRKKAVIIITVLFLIQGLFVVGVLTHSSINHSKEIKTAIEQLNENQTIHTNSAFVIPHTNAKIELNTALSVAPLFSNFFKDPSAEIVILNLNETPCPSRGTYCQKQKDEQLSTIIENNQLLNCGYLHGTATIIISKNSSTEYTKEKCLSALQLPPQKHIETKVHLRFSSVTINTEGDINYINNIVKLITKAHQKGQKTSISFVPTEISLSPASLLQLASLPPETNIGINYIPKKNNSQFIERIAEGSGREVTFIVPLYDEWVEINEVLPQTITTCLLGSWSNQPQNLQCETIDLYTVLNWQQGVFREPEEINKEIDIIKHYDNTIIIDVPGYLLNDENTKKIELILKTHNQK